MTRFVWGAVAAIAAGLSLPAQAADLNYNSRAPYTVNQPLNAYSWAGPYLGGNVGYSWGSVDNAWAKPSGFVGGLQAGYNWQQGPWVFGVEGDIQASSADDMFAAGKEILAIQPDNVNIMVPMGMIGLIKSYNKENKYAADSTRYAQMALDALKAELAARRQ